MIVQTLISDRGVGGWFLVAGRRDGGEELGFEKDEGRKVLETF